MLRSSLRRAGRCAPVLLIALATAPGAAAASTEMFVQTARSATVVEQRGARLTLTLRVTPATVLRFDDRPQRRSSRFSVDRFADLWSSGFEDDPPNAALVGSHRGRSTQTVVELLDARRVRGGMRYTVRAHDGTPPRRLRDVSLFVDPLPIDGVDTDLVLPPGDPIVVAPTEAPFQESFSSVMFMPGGALELVGASFVKLSFSGYGQAAAVAAASSVPPTSVYENPTSGGTLMSWQLAPGTTLAIRPTTTLTLIQVLLQAAP